MSRTLIVLPPEDEVRLITLPRLEALNALPSEVLGETEGIRAFQERRPPRFVGR